MLFQKTGLDTAKIRLQTSISGYFSFAGPGSHNQLPDVDFEPFQHADPDIATVYNPSPDVDFKLFQHAGPDVLKLTRGHRF